MRLVTKCPLHVTNVPKIKALQTILAFLKVSIDTYTVVLICAVGVTELY